jgi:hypothetical protein
MKGLMILCGNVLLVGVADMPIGYYTLLRILVTIGGFDLPRVVSQIVPVLDRWKDDPEYNMLAAMLLMKTLPSLFNSSDDYLMTALVPFLY